MYQVELSILGCQVHLHIPQTTPEEDLTALHDLFRQAAAETFLEEGREMDERRTA